MNRFAYLIYTALIIHCFTTSMEMPPGWNKSKRKQVIKSEEEESEVTRVSRALKNLKVDDRPSSRQSKRKHPGSKARELKLIPIHDLTDLIHQGLMEECDYNYTVSEKDYYYLRYFKNMVQEIHRYLPLYDDTEASVFSNETKVEELATSTNWNTLAHYKKNVRFPFLLFQHQLWIQRNEDKNGNDITELRLVNEETKEQVFIEPHPGSGQVLLDGPNADNITLIAINKQKDPIKNQRSHSYQSFESVKPYASCHYLLQLAGTKRLERVEHCEYESYDKPDHKITALALAARNGYALATQNVTSRKKHEKKMKTEQRHFLSIFAYTYDTNLKSQLVARGPLPAHLKKIAFVTQNVLIGLTKNSDLITLWPDEKSIDYASQNMPTIIAQDGTPKKMVIHDFAIDPVHPNQLIINYSKDNEREQNIAFIDLKLRDKQGRILFKKILSAFTPLEGLYFYNDMICATKRNHAARDSKSAEIHHIKPVQKEHIMKYIQQLSKQTMSESGIHP